VEVVPFYGLAIYCIHGSFAVLVEVVPFYRLAICFLNILLAAAPSRLLVGLYLGHSPVQLVFVLGVLCEYTLDA
jgi:hypothetical protein